MARIPTIDSRDQLPKEDQGIWDAIAKSRAVGPTGAEVKGSHPIMLHSPQMALQHAMLGALLRFRTDIDDSIRELVMLTVGRETRTQSIWSYHVEAARRAGVREEAIDALRSGSDPIGLTADEAVIVRYVKQTITEHKVDDETFGTMLARFGVRRLVELTALAGYFAMGACIHNAFQVEPRFPDRLRT